MKKLIIAMACLLSVGTLQAQDAKTQAPNPNAPKFQFKGGDTHDFGTVKEGDPAEYAFEFKNVGKEPLIIQNASASCGCTTPVWPKEPVLPGKTNKIIVKYNTMGRPGPFSKEVFLTSNAVGDKERYELHIKGTVEPKAAAPADQKK